MNNPDPNNENFSDIIKRLKSDDNVPTPEEVKEALKYSSSNTLKKLGHLARKACEKPQEGFQKANNAVIRHKRKIAAGVTAIAAAVPIVGWPAEVVSASDTVNSMRARHAERYQSFSPEEKFRATYTDPWTLSDNTKVGGFGVRGILTNTKEVSLVIGERCLVGGPYDITPRRTVDGSTTRPAKPISSAISLEIKPANGATPLLFTITNGELIPSDETQTILNEHTCAPSGIEIQNGPEVETEPFDIGSNELRPRHPGSTNP